jgi:phosphate transport system substrate-binding protein
MTFSRSLAAVRAAAALASALLAVPRPEPSAAQAAPQRVPASAVAIVVHPDTPVDGLTLRQLREYFLAVRREWPNRQRVVLLVREPTAPERDVVLRVIYNMSEQQYRQYWAGERTRADVLRQPRGMESALLARRMVGSRRGALTFIPARMVTSGMKQLRINGKLPGEPGYPLQ